MKTKDSKTITKWWHNKTFMLSIMKDAKEILEKKQKTYSLEEVKAILKAKT